MRLYYGQHIYLLYVLTVLALAKSEMQLWDAKKQKPG